MKKVIKLFSLVLLLAITVANSGLLFYSLHQAKAISVSGNAVNLAPKPTQKVASAKQRTVDPNQQGNFLADGQYAFNTQDKSRINTTNQGSLVLAAFPASEANFVIATNGSTKIDDSIVTDGWKTTLLANDPLWAPGACSAKPTLLLQGRYIFIDDGKTNPEDKYNSYLVFDMQTGKYHYFGGDSFTVKQASHENIMLATNENDQLVFYIDQSDPDGSQADSSSFKHSVGHALDYIVRRVIDPATMGYKDYKIPFINTDTLFKDVYHLSLFNKTDDKQAAGQANATLHYTSDVNDGTAEKYMSEGIVVNNAITLKKYSDNFYTVSAVATPGPFDTELEKQLNDPLTKALPSFIVGKPHDAASYSTNFMLTALGVHGQTNYIVASSRNGEYAQTPVIVDSDGTVHPLTVKTVLKLGAYVPLGVF